MKHFFFQKDYLLQHVTYQMQPCVLQTVSLGMGVCVSLILLEESL